jgi:hypothetical protein
MKNTLLIAFNGGAYGTYLEWVVNTLMSRDSITNPFTKLGNSHNSNLGQHLIDIYGFNNYLNSDNEYLTARVHPKTQSSEKISNNLNYMLDHVPKMILLYPDPDLELMSVCNFVTKIWDTDHIYNGAMSYTNLNDIYEGYNIDPGTDLRTIPAWITREHMSFSLFSSWHDQVEWYFPNVWHHDRCLIVTTKELLNNFKLTIQRIFDFWGTAPVRPISDLETWHKKMLLLQLHLGKDQLCKTIIDSVTNQCDPLSWDNLCMVSQAWIQHQLRLKGYEMLCHDLNEFPTDTDSLKSFIFKSDIS